MAGDVKLDLELIPESTKEEILNPSANLFGQASRGILHFFLDPFVKFNIIRDQDLEDFKNKVVTKNSDIPTEHRDDSKANLAYKAIEDAKFQLGYEELQNMFSNLISSTLDSRKNDMVLPGFSSILRDLSAEDAQLLLHFSKNNALPLVTIRLENDNSVGIGILEHILLIDIGFLHSPLSIASLERLGVITLKETKLQANAHLNKYDSFKSSPLYKHYENKLPVQTEEFTFTKVVVEEMNATLTSLGKDFLKVVTE